MVTAGRSPQRLADVVVTTELVGRDRIEATGATNVAEVLSEQTGIHLDGGHPTGAGVMLQGLDAERVLVLLDGQPLGGRISGNLDLSRIPTGIVERIEVVKGPQATLYGSEAMGGVVNLVTATPDSAAWAGTATLTAGTRGRREAHGTLRGGSGPVSFAADVGRRQLDLTPGLESASGTGTDRWDGHFRGRWIADSTVSLETSFFLVDEAQRWRSGQLHHFADNLQWTGRINGRWTSDSGIHRFEPTLYTSSFDHLSRRSSSTSPPAPETGSRQMQQLWEAEALYGWDGEGVRVETGIEAQREAIEAATIRGKERVLTSIEPFVQLPLRRGAVTLVPGVRASWNSEWGTHWTPRLSALVRPAASVALRASVARGYRAPGFKELYMQFLNVGPGFGYVVRGNPALSPETSTAVNGGVEWNGTRAYGRLQLFHNRFRDFIETRAVGDSSGVTVYTYGNVDDGTTAGVEAELGYLLKALRAEAGYSLLETENEVTGQELLGRPRHSGRFSLRHAAEFGLRSTVTGVFTGAATVSLDGDSARVRPGFLRVDFRLSQAVRRGLRASVGVENVFDETVDGWPGFTGRTLYLTLSAEAPELFPGGSPR
ncbi:MAG: TonB-dependent receptor [Gemmatimonadetes bacterium]|nr:TonB-dependent receptor [Gemmatimonadota bacterium]NIT89205.1 TonB-dependent receptor [Gemmatimonadota bacterium]NIU33005.1 TonB-dependent receptor [Gemmatimonadota bacterium]NIU37389.1 TonB-dependent receptor [Gemmatimonadota bacterium]NIV63364.1 TonB-dependent receptor [Gemmatimonadota bacterium]